LKPEISEEAAEPQYRMWKQHPDAQARMPDLSEKEIDRQEIIYEYITTETSYNRDLDIIQRVLFLPEVFF